MQAFGANAHTQNVIHKIEQTKDYQDLKPSYRNDYMFWRTYWMLNYNYGYMSPYCYNRYYVWMPYYLYGEKQIHVVRDVQSQARKQDLKWIRVGKVAIAVPDKIYQKAKIGQKVELIDDTHIKIDGHIYTK